MNVHRSKKIGLFSTIIVHVMIILFCILSSINYTHSDIPNGIEIEILAYSEPNIDPNQIEKVSDSKVNNDIQTKQVKIIQDEIDDLVISSDVDTTIQSNSIEPKVIESISQELEDLFSQLNNIEDIPNENNNDLKQDIIIKESENTISGLVDDYQLSDNRLAIIKVKPNYICNETGTIIVRVWVNREGKTIKAEAGIRGTTDSSSCLTKEAESAALNTTWTPFLDAPETQIGQITYNFYQN
jgi:hypothetical protein